MPKGDAVLKHDAFLSLVADIIWLFVPHSGSTLFDQQLLLGRKISDDSSAVNQLRRNPPEKKPYKNHAHSCPVMNDEINKRYDNRRL